MSILQAPLGELASTAQPEIGEREIREQLNRILADSLFRNSRRYPKLLRYVVDTTLAGREDSLKERTLGVEVFGKAPDYNTNEDHIVRSTAAEVRKRLIQYHQQPAHLDEIRIEMPSGSYIPRFQWPSPGRPAPGEEHSAEVADASPGWLARRRNWTICAAAAGLVLLVVLILSGRGRIESPSAALGRFWAPVYQNSGTVTLFTGDPSRAYLRDADSAPAYFRGLLPRNIPFSDAVTLTRVGALLSLKNKNYRVVYSPASTLEDLRQGPAVLIGGVDNYWAVRLTSDLRFRLVAERTPDRFAIEEAATGKIWRTPPPVARTEMTVDYALITRVRHPTTGQFIVIAGGVEEFGTLASGEFLTNGAALAELERLAPKGWNGGNVQAVLSTNVMRNAPSPPKIIVAHFW